MSKRWRIAGLLLAAAAFSYTLISGGSILAGPEGLPVVATALYAAVAVFVAVWLYEGVVHVLQWLGRLLSMPGPSDRG